MDNSEKRCPDCAVEMEELALRAIGHNNQIAVVTDEPRDGLLGRFGPNKKHLKSGRWISHA